MKKLLTIIAIMTICDAYGETIFWFTNTSTFTYDACENNNNITKPEDPQKNGFRFIGWKEPDNSAPYIRNILMKYYSDSIYPSLNDTPPNIWTATFPWGTINGAWRCSTDGNDGDISCYNDYSNTCTTSSDPTLTGNGCGTNNSFNCPNKNASGNNAKNCWCKLTDSAGLVDVSSLAWVFRQSHSTAANCATTCAFYCANLTGNSQYRGYRVWIFGVN